MLSYTWVGQEAHFAPPCVIREKDIEWTIRPTVYGTTVVSSESGHVTFFQRSGTCVCGEGTFRIFGPKTISAVMLSQWENGAFLFKLIVTAKLLMLLQRYDLAHVQN